MKAVAPARSTGSLFVSMPMAGLGMTTLINLIGQSRLMHSYCLGT